MKQSLFLTACFFLQSFAFSQERNQADVSISSVTLGMAPANNNNATISKPGVPTNTISNPNASQAVKNSRLMASSDLKCTITVHNENDDDAYETVLVAVLPVEVSVLSIPANATVHKNVPGSPFAGYITFNLGHMTVGQNITVEFTFTKSKYGNKVGGYAYSGTPDPNPANNYKEASF